LFTLYVRPLTSWKDGMDGSKCSFVGSADMYDRCLAAQRMC
jgi:hypothetical protein